MDETGGDGAALIFVRRLTVDRRWVERGGHLLHHIIMMGEDQDFTGILG